MQAPEYEIRFLNKAFKQHTGRKPLHLREDFCGTALLCSKWAKSDPERTALGLDIDRPTLDWGRERNLAPIGDAAKRVTLLEQDIGQRRPAYRDYIARTSAFIPWPPKRSGAR